MTLDERQGGSNRRIRAASIANLHIRQGANAATFFDQRAKQGCENHARFFRWHPLNRLAEHTRWKVNIAKFTRAEGTIVAFYAEIA